MSSTIIQKTAHWFFILIYFAGPGIVQAQSLQKKPMDHSVYDSWNRIQNAVISNDGGFVTYEIDPHQGDGSLYLYNVKDHATRTLERGTQAAFSEHSDFLVWKIKPPYQLIRSAKKDKKNKEDMPEDSLGILILGDGSIKKFERVQAFKVPEEGPSLVIIHHFPAGDTTVKDTVQSNKKRNTVGGDLEILEPLNNICTTLKGITAWNVSKNGSLLAFVRQTSDTLRQVSVGVFDTGMRAETIVFEATGRIEQLVVHESGSQLAFLYHTDTAKISGYSLYHWSAQTDAVKMLVDTLTEGLPVNYGVSKNGKLWFAEDGSKLFLGTAIIPDPVREDTLLEEEKTSVDIWSWGDDLLQSMQKIRIREEQQKTYLACYDFQQQQLIQLADTLVEIVQTLPEGNGEIALGIASRPYNKWLSWKAGNYRDLYLINMTTGGRTDLLKTKNGPVYLSPAGKYVLWYETADSNWYTHEIATDHLVCLTCNIEPAFYNEIFDMPADPNPYGIAGWTKNDESVLVYDRYDIWKFDPSGTKIALNLTNSYGRRSKIILRYQQLDTALTYIPGDSPMLLHGLCDSTKQTGFFAGSIHLKFDPEELIRGDFYFESPVKARDKNVLFYQRGSFSEYPDLWITDLTFRNKTQISAANPQSIDYYWGSPRLVHWTSFNREQLDGILYVPEDISDRKYPMLVYFYERSSAGMFRHSIPAPSRSTINIPWCVSNGYVVFVPDIKYRTGYPGESAYDAVISGTEAMVRQFGFIDEEHMALQGQSWGGYQVAYLITRTDMFKAAMAGAPVANMTSAYGGIRWSSGMSRMFLYEQSQSRIGGTLWDKTPLYLENSPLFHATEINTPLLIMHNDNDGAVPWYQGIELFVALRRLNKPVWMLVYNNEEHNLDKWPNRKDLSIRMMQFFDHYLKGAPAPVWMEQGIPAVEKGKNSGYELIE